MDEVVNQDVLLLVRNPENQDNTGIPSKRCPVEYVTPIVGGIR
jgi:hypothetical protein